MKEYVKRRRKEEKNPVLIKCLAVYVPSQFISLCLESIADVCEKEIAEGGHNYFKNEAHSSGRV